MLKHWGVDLAHRSLDVQAAQQRKLAQRWRRTTGAVIFIMGAVIWAERQGQKGTVIGKGGERLREIGARARQQMEKLFDAKVFLETWVRVREGWSDDEAALKSLGYHD